MDEGIKKLRKKLGLKYTPDKKYLRPEVQSRDNKGFKQVTIT